MFNNGGIDIELMPYEKALRYGIETLTDVEILAVILRTGVGKIKVLDLAKLLYETAGNKGLVGLASLEIDDLVKIKGIGRVKAIQIKSIIELSKRLAKLKANEKLDFSRSETVAKFYMQDLRHLQQEHLILVLLDSKCCLIKDMVLTVGTVNSSLIDTRDIFIKALKSGAVQIMLIHNHPSGDPTPSKADINVTKEIYEAGKILGVNLTDHIVIGDNTYVSLKAIGIF
ncbi:DNA replication and repair protein RadC [Lachnospira multipara]|jgi:DNA repair protein RadC|uniref:DNA replication and repair protein RadC n=3 Tax=Lachnospiraceae TaxID=186803 RepID=A0A1H5RKE8_9FIRM|nr:DNA repair protein RadC [Lachnospira pectinoschiza]SDM70569.1 DNA replication and repair protein RadC [Lachnospira pectinoschiza]SEF38842.1 DNA replication and repair protein RadC [Lachnospira multipara]